LVSKKISSKLKRTTNKQEKNLYKQKKLERNEENMKFRFNSPTIAIYFLFVFLWMNLMINATQYVRLGLEDATLAASSTWSEGYVVDNIKTDTSILKRQWCSQLPSSTPAKTDIYNSLWHSIGGRNNWITIKFPYDVQLRGFRVKRPYSWDGSAFKGYSFQVSDDKGGAWADVHSGTHVGENQLCCDFQTITFDTPTTGNYFRLFMNSNYGYGHHTISYMELLKTEEDEEKKMKEKQMEKEERLLQMAIKLSNEEEELQMAIKLSNEEETNRLKAQELRKQDEDKKNGIPRKTPPNGNKVIKRARK